MANSSITNISNEFQPSNSGGSAVVDQSLTVAGTAVAMMATAANADTDYVHWTLTGANAYVTYDGSDPVGGSNGHYVAENSSGVWSKEMAAAAIWIREGATSARLHISEFQSR